MDITDSLPAAAVLQVFETYELLENILSHLPFFDLVHAQQVSKQWRDITMRSKVLRQNLFLDPQTCHGDQKFNLNVALRDFQDGGIQPQPQVLVSHPTLEDHLAPRDIEWQVYSHWSIRAPKIGDMLSWPDGQLRNMLLSRPAMSHVYVVFEPRPEREAWWEMSDCTGVRLGAVVNALKREVEKRHLSMDDLTKANNRTFLTIYCTQGLDEGYGGIATS